MSGLNLEYYYGNEADTYTFYRIPKTLFSDPAFAGVSCEAKVLYGLMLDRMGLSIKNNWLDKENRVFIYFTLEDVCENLRCGHDKGVKLMAELDGVKGIGLIERVKQGLGKPCKIYVKNCVMKAEVQTSDNPKSGTPKNPGAACGDAGVQDIEDISSRILENQQIAGSGKAEVQTSDNPKSGLPIFRGADFGKTEGNKTEYIKTESNETDLSIYPHAAGQVCPNAEYRMDVIDDYRQMIADNISYDLLRDGYGIDRADSVLELLTETVCSSRKNIRIGGEDMPAEVVKSRLLKLDHSHVEYVFDCMDANTTKVRNIHAYLITSLYRAPVTIEPYYRAEVNHDLGGG